jgi:hypothetical protein
LESGHFRSFGNDDLGGIAGQSQGVRWA